MHEKTAPPQGRDPRALSLTAGIDLRTGDLNGDGAPDFVVSDVNGTMFYVILSNP